MRILSRVLVLIGFFFGSCLVTLAQVAPRPLVTQPIDESQLVTLKGNTHPLARPEFDIGVAPPDQPLRRMLLVLKRSPEQQFALTKLLDDQQDKTSPNYHKWLTPDEFGAKFGPADQDIQAVAGWLQSHGLQVNRVTHGKTIVEFSGVESQLEEALHTQIHKYLVNAEEHWANASDPQIPAALAPVVAGVQALNNFRATAFSEVGGVVSRDKSTGKFTPVNPSKPLFTLGGRCGVQPSDCYAVGPYDFATIYDVLPAWNATPATDGTGETIAIVGETDINLQDVTDFRNFFGLPAYGQTGGPALHVIHDGVDPGILQDGEESESDLDVEWSGAVAKGASIDFVVTQATEVTLGVNLSALYIVDHNLDPVMSESYGICELFIGPSGNQFFSALWQQAAAQGITVMLASGDSSSAGCDNRGVAAPAHLGLQVSGFASTPYNVAVGGTDFNDLTNAASFWSATNNSTTQASALSYIPETTWDDNCTNPVFGDLLGFSKNAETNCNNAQLVGDGFVNIIGGSGGKSGCINSDGQDPSSCAGGYAKPSWQNAPGVPGDNARDMPDVSLFAANGSPSGSFYIICEADLVSPGSSSCNPSDPATEFIPIGGTSASSPAFAGVMALVNQQQQARQGNANFVLYNLARSAPSAFHDVTTGTIRVPCQIGSPDCKISNAGDSIGILDGYDTGPGYDLATGIGSVDVNNLLQNWSLAKFTATTTNFSLSQTTNLTHGQAVNVTGSVAPTNASGTPTGIVTLLTSTGLSVDGLKLNGGAVSGTTNLLPGGSYSVTAHYSGDPTFASSDSQPVSVTVGKENSNSQLQLVTFDFNGNLINDNASTTTYGSPYILRVNVLNSQSAACQPNPLGESGCPTGNVTLTDNGNALGGGTFALNSMGYTEDQFPVLPGGSDTIEAKYAGDSSFNASSASTTYNITPDATTISAPSSLSTVTVGSNFSSLALVAAALTLGTAPTGSVTFFANGTPILGSENSTGTPGTFANPRATLAVDINSTSSPFPTPGTYTLTAVYSGDANYQSSSSAPTNVVAQFPSPSMSLAASSLSVAAGSSVTLTAIVHGESKTTAPTGTFNFTDECCNLVVAGTVQYSTIPNSNGNLDLQGTITFTPVASDAYEVSYSGDANYPGTFAEMGAPVVVNGSDFSISPTIPSISVVPGGTANESFILGTESNTQPVTLSSNPCSGLPQETTCAIVSNFGTNNAPAEISVSTTGPHPIAAVSRAASFACGYKAAMLPFAFALCFCVSRRSRGVKLAALSLALACVGCGGGGGGGSGGGGSIDPGTPAGNYTITVSATSGSGANAITHTTTFTLVVQ